MGNPQDTFFAFDLPHLPADYDERRSARLISGSVRGARLRGPEGCTMTVRTALAIVERVLAGEAPPGFPRSSYGRPLALPFWPMVTKRKASFMNET